MEQTIFFDNKKIRTVKVALDRWYNGKDVLKCLKVPEHAVLMSLKRDRFKRFYELVDFHSFGQGSDVYLNRRGVYDVLKQTPSDNFLKKRLSKTLNIEEPLYDYFEE